MDLNLVSRWEKSVEAHDELRVASEEAGNASNDSGRVDALALKLLHDVEEVVVDLWLVAKLELDLVQVGERVFDFEPLEIGIVGGVGGVAAATAAAAVDGGRCDDGADLRDRWHLRGTN